MVSTCGYEQTGDLRDKTPMTNYRVRQQYDTCDDVSMQTYCVNIYDEGRTLSVVTDAGAHGTHVASIIGAYDKDREELRGIAPGCKIVSVRIGDRRVSGSMETCLGMVRAADAVRQNRCDVVNMSYGEPTVSPRFPTVLFSRHFVILWRRTMVFVTSAGNAGPALSTCGAPCEPLSDVVVGVGAYVSRDMMSAQYSLLENILQTAFTWTVLDLLVTVILVLRSWHRCCDCGRADLVSQVQAANERYVDGITERCRCRGSDLVETQERQDLVQRASELYVQSGTQPRTFVVL